jgi:hypothetical protein
MPKVFCIDGVVVDILESKVTNERLKYYELMPIENQPIMAGILRDQGITLLSPEMGHQVVDKFNGMMLEDINTETFKAVSEALEEHGYPVGGKTDWP